MTAASLELLLAELEPSLADGSPAGRVAKLLEAYARSGAQDWRAYALFGADYYARNLVRGSDLFELIVLCWGPGQRSPIHDHHAQRCWMAVLEGQVLETLYRPAQGRGAALVPCKPRTFEHGSVAYIDDDLGWHRIEPHGRLAAVTLHLYSRPIRQCQIFDEASGTIRAKTMIYHSVGGVLQPARG